MIFTTTKIVNHVVKIILTIMSTKLILTQYFKRSLFY